MPFTTSGNKVQDNLEFLAGGGELGRMISEYDWSSTPLGPITGWSPNLKTCIRIMLTSRQPMWLGWGKELIKLYNDPYKAIVGGKHPWALGKPASVVWKDIWHDISPMLKRVMENDEGTYAESQLLIMERNGYPEETYYTFSYTPIPGEDGTTAGMICANTDDTERIISERHLRTLTQLGKNLTGCKTKKEIICRTIETLQENPYDFPFALFRSIQQGKAVLEACTELGESGKLIPDVIDLTTENMFSATINEALNTREIQVFDHLLERVGELPKGGWHQAPDKTMILPIYGRGIKELYGMLTIGLNPYSLLNDKYRSFFSLISDQVASSFNNINALDEERKRAEALSEVDKAKTIFFSNISHEFRTPLTLILGPIEEILNDPSTIPSNKLRIETAFRNALRMQRLVNTLLEFSRIEAGRVEGKFSRVDIGLFTEELASTFRSAIEKAGIELQFSAEKIDEEVYVDIEMWEKIVLNLLSNALKYTKAGKISVNIKNVNGYAELSVSDTGIGIAEDQINKIFDRFHRIDNIHGRSREGTGIGLALVKELVKLNYGKILVTSKYGEGTTFTIHVPFGKEHIPPEKILENPNKNAASSKTTAAFLQEALKWVDGNDPAFHTGADPTAEQIMHQNSAEKKYTVLLCDDNADMLDYVERLLSGHFHVITATDGEDAFQKALGEKPDLLLTDIMMPKLDGFGLLKKIRNHPDLKNLPVIFLSARAGEEAKIEGLDAGADDYLIKPFSGKELLARVDANIKIAKNRIASENNLRSMIRQSPVATTVLRGPEMVVDIVNEKALEIWGRAYDEVMNKPILEALPEIIAQGLGDILKQVYSTGEPFRGNEFPVSLLRYGKNETVYLNFIYDALRNEDNEINGILAVAFDITEQVLARKKIEQSQKELNELANAVPQLVWVSAPAGEINYYNNRISEFSGAEKKEDGNWHWMGLLHEDDVLSTAKAWEKAIETGTEYQCEHRVKLKDGSFRWYLSRAIPHKDENGKILKWFGTATDIHVSKEHATLLEEEVKKRTRELKELNVILRQSNADLQQFAHVASHDLKEPLRKIKTFTGRLSEDPGSVFSEKARVYMDKVNSATDRMNMMIEGVLNYSTVNASQAVIETVNLDELIKTIENDLDLLINQKSAKIEYSGLPVVEGAFVLLYQLFYNLINNSLKFSKEGREQHITISSEIIEYNNIPYAEIKVKDRGIGFHQNFAEKIFITFTRLNSKDRFEGTGLGLALCKRIVERHGGSIEAFGKEDEGALFIIRLPLIQNFSKETGIS